MKQNDDRKTVSVTKDVYKSLKEYCDKNGLKIRWLLEKIITEYIKDEKNSIKNS
jgi:hypothetical protein